MVAHGIAENLLFLMGLACALSSFFIPMQRQRRLIAVLLIVQTLCAVTFWFKIAPDPRFGYAALLLCGVNGFYSLTTAIIGLSVIRARLFAYIITLGSFHVIGKNEFSWIARQGKKFPHGFPVADLEFKITKVRLKE
jgi:hypothetical protein